MGPGLGTLIDEAKMKQIELRLAVVLYGGVSLAVYIHGVTREILNMVRASKLFHVGSGAEPPTDETTAVYYDLFKELSATIDLRVVVDLISGASAGGINGVMLGRALAHDLPLEPHRDLWLRNADVTSLAAPASLLSRWGKVLIAPLVERLLSGRFGQEIDDPETRGKLRKFVQSQWFKPPFSGERFAGWMLDACDAMDEQVADRQKARQDTLLPPGHRMDLFVTLTDYLGHRHHIELHDPASVEETEHRRIVPFTCSRNLSGDLTSDFKTEDVPSLIFAARATASFPGAFPPAAVSEMDRILTERRRAWPSRARFITEKLQIPDVQDGASRYFIDGSVVMNKPFSPVIHALGHRPASREIARRIIYVDPNPHRETAQRSANGTPGFFRTVLSAMALIPRNEPIADDLLSIQAWNERARRMAEILAAADPQIEHLVRELFDRDPQNPPSIAEVGRYRAQANEAAHAGVGYAYLSYQTLKRRRLIDQLANLIASLARSAGKSADIAQINALLDRSCGRSDGRNGQEIVAFLRAFDIDFRLRRIRFVIRRLNELYRTLGDSGQELDSRSLDDLKQILYETVERIRRLWEPDHYSPEVAQAAGGIAMAAAAGETLDPEAFAALETAMRLTSIDQELDEVISLMGLAYLPPVARRAVGIAYVGFAFYDLITFPILQWTEMDEINEVLVDRISPIDARGMGPEKVTLKGTALMNFGAFFNRAWREHDYLWGRLNAADRCIDMLVSAIGTRALETIDVDGLRARLFRAILDAEAPHLLADPDLVPGLRRRLDGQS